MQKILTKYSFVWLIPILLLAAVLRFTGTNWDNNAHLHPDERYMTMVAVAIEWPESFAQYLDPQTSPLSPANKTYGSYIYGTFPLFLVKYTAERLELGDYDNLVIVGRTMSGVIDIGNLLLIYFIGNNVYKKRLGLLAALLYAVAVMPIQQSHFFTTDTYETFFVLITFSLLIIFLRVRSPLINSFISVLIGLSMGLALASKISAVVFGGVIALAIGMKFLQQFKKISHARNILYCIDFALLIGITTYIVLRLAQPYIFANSSFFDITPHPEFINALNFQRLAIAGEVMFPPQWSWIGKTPYLYPLKNIFIWGMGIPLGLAAVMGILSYLYDQFLFLKHHYHLRQLLIPLTSPLLLAFAWVVGDFLYRGGNFVLSFRYLLAIIPFLIIFASLGIYQLQRINKKLFVAGLAFVFVPTLLWATAFISIYTRPTTRITASEWVYENVTADKTIANEHWDDAIPFATDGPPPFIFSNSVELEVYGPDDEKKIPYLFEKLNQTDYIFVTSDRARGNIGKLPEDFPVMTQYYKALDEGTLGFTKVSEITSFPQLFGIEINDSSAEEAFWVYDHPTVRIYRKDRSLPETEFACVLQGKAHLDNGRCVEL